ncbi:MAG: hypothetical protein ACI82F_002698 [Planctomycetota bacterium]|jgi:hypothetical protein
MPSPKTEEIKRPASPGWRPAGQWLVLVLVPFAFFVAAAAFYRNGPTHPIVHFPFFPDGAIAVEVIPDTVPSGKWGWDLATSRSPTARLGAGSPEGTEEYIKRMLRALEFKGELLEVSDSTSQSLGGWICRLDSILMRCPEGRLDALQLVTLRDTATAVLHPVLFRANSPGRFMPGVELFAVDMRRSRWPWSKPRSVNRWLQQPRPEFALSYDGNYRSEGVLERYGATDFIAAEE